MHANMEASALSRMTVSLATVRALATLARTVTLVSISQIEMCLSKMFDLMKYVFFWNKHVSNFYCFVIFTPGCPRIGVSNLYLHMVYDIENLLVYYIISMS
jgi:hypothetical protein